jgi:uncharacterized membrane protein
MEESFTHDNEHREPKSVDSIIASGYHVNGLVFLRKGMRYFSDEFGIYVAFTLVYIALSMALSALPVVGDVSGMLVGPPLVAGFAYYMRLQSRNEYREFSHFFGGFRGGQWPSLVSQGVSVTLSLALAVALVVLPFFLEPIQVFVTEFEKIQTMDQEKAAEFMVSLFTPQIGLAAFIAAVVALLVLTFFSLAPLFIVYRGYSAFQAIGASWKLVSKKYPSFFLFNLLLWIMLIAGFLMCCVGLLVALPVYYLSMASAYEEITGD